MGRSHSKNSRLCSFVLATLEENGWDSENVLRKKRCNFTSDWVELFDSVFDSVNPQALGAVCCFKQLKGILFVGSVS